MSSNTSFYDKFKEICRTCLKQNQILTHLYDEPNNINLIPKLETCTALKFDENDQMPDKICPTCIEELLQAYNFINKCQISDATLQKYLLNETVKLETFDEHFDLISDISIKDELIVAETDAIEDSYCYSMENNKKRKWESFDCTVNLSKKMKVVDTANKLNNTFDVIENHNNTGGSDFGAVKHVRKTRSCNWEAKKTMRFSCPVCHKRFNSHMGLLKHVQKYSETKPLEDKEKNKSLKCQICRENFTKLDNLIKHYKHHITAYKCKFCDTLFPATKLRRHIQRAHGNARPYPCKLCTKRFPNFEARQSHIDEHHCSNKSHKCSICFYTFDYLKQLNSHVINHVGDGPYTCLTCKKTFENAPRFIKHKTELKCGRFYLCSDCPIVFQMNKLKFMHKSEHN